MRVHSGGLITLIGAQIDSVTVDELPKAIQFDLAVRFVGTPKDFEVPHELEVVLRNPATETIGELSTTIEPRQPAATAMPGYEINLQRGLRIDFEAEDPGGYDLLIRLDGKLQGLSNSLTLSILLAGES